MSAVPMVVERSDDLPLVRAQITVDLGGGDDPAGQDGLCNFAAELMARGAAGRGRAELDRAFDRLGSGLDILCDHDSVTFEVSVLVEKLDEALALMSDVLLRPDFADGELQKLRRELLAQLDDVRDDDGGLARRFFQRALYGAHPYGRTILGTAQSIAGHDAARARAWHQRVLVGEHTLFGLAGAIDEAAGQAAWARHFANFPSGSTVGAPRERLERRPGRRILIVDKPERTQSQILFGQPALAWSDPDFFALQVATTAFGGTFTARLMNEIRSKRGLSYGASARLGHGRGEKALVGHVFPSLAQTAETLTLVLDLWRAWVEDGLTDAEVEFARGYLAAGFAFHLATPEDRLDLEVAVRTAGMDRNYRRSYVDKTLAVTPDDVRRAMRTHLSARDLQVVIVSTADELMPTLEKTDVLTDATVDVVPFDSY